MAALTSDRDTPARDGRLFVHPVKAGVAIYAGALVMLDATGAAVPASAATTLKPAGRAAYAMTGGSADGDASVTVERGCFRWGNAGDITRTHTGSAAYAVDDQTVSATATGRSACGVIRDIDALGVWVEV
ncbi:hypothetical protein [Pararhodospirillum photometricum]|uniref:Bacteriophage protein n=1 Tax=Pararhodospirillum photometricum DSM 122 TaxID=1150469 RepID=H6SQN4_PARPM|nr:hypothetical protein [Pararhodospirillum photometricum]CCG07349.1 Putative uncharacterized protein [Pararhodospirillum photometricum DSM 122]